MAIVVGIRFKEAGKVYYFDPGALALREGDGVIVETARGVEYAQVIQPPHEVGDEEVVAPLKKVLRAATAEDVKRVAENKKRCVEAQNVFAAKVASHGLDMKLVDVETAFDNSKLTFYFTAEGRIDFRELVKDLAAVFKTRIELRQIGVRDEARMLGGIGPCGRVACCAQFMTEFHPVSIRMAKEQNLSLNPTKISGLCGRLMCCLKYEQDYYESMRKKMPKLGKEVTTPDGNGVVIENNTLKATCRVRMPMPDGTMEVREFSVYDVVRRAEGEPSLAVPKDLREPKEEKGAGQRNEAYGKEANKDSREPRRDGARRDGQRKDGYRSENGRRGDNRRPEGGQGGARNGAGHYMNGAKKPPEK